MITPGAERKDSILRFEIAKLHFRALMLEGNPINIVKAQRTECPVTAARMGPSVLVIYNVSPGAVKGS
jgi:hypothetical protein